MAFPSTIVQKFLKSGFNERHLDNIIRSDTGHGLPKFRKRFTGRSKTFTGSIILDDASQYTSFITWYYAEALEGAAYFSFADPHGGSALSLRIIDLQIETYAEIGWMIHWMVQEQPHA